MIGKTFFIYIKKETMMTRSQMKIVAAGPITLAVLTGPAVLTALNTPALIVPTEPAILSVAAPAPPVFYPSMFDRWAIPF
jgi:hypothetical protein|uniref:Uncharacterized protein n=1 Tax=viral metagenome TaxID=1070528 RepID=A0A6C0CEF3_9ZZZZ